MTRRAIAYVRKSTAEAERRSLTEQEADLRRHADALGLQVVDVLAEEASAYAERERPVFSRALAAVEQGEAEALLCWALDRFSRRGAGHVMGLVDQGLRLVTLDGIDTSQEHGRMQVAVMAEAARLESLRISLRTKRAKAAARDDGRWHAGRAPYGYRTEGQGRTLRLVPHAEEAAAVRRIADHLAECGSIASIVRTLNEEGVPTPAGEAWKAKGQGLHWTAQSVKSLMRSPALAGFLPHQGEALRDDDGARIVAHEPIVPAEVWDRVQLALNARRRSARHGGNNGGGRPRSRLLSGLLRCTCGVALTANSRGYSCSAPKGTGVPHVRITSSVEHIVPRLALRRLATLEPDSPELLAVAEAWATETGQAPDAGERRIREDAVEVARAEVDRVVRLVAKGLIEEDEAARLLPDLRAAVREAEARLAELGASAVDVSALLDLAATADTPEADPTGEGSAWAALSTADQRAVLAALLETVDVLPTTRGARNVKARLRPVWREA